VSKPRISKDDLCRNAKRLGTAAAEVQAFLEVETKNHGFDDHDRPVILFERHWFHKLTGGKYDRSHPRISNPTPGGYGRSSEQYDRFSEAFHLDPQAAMKSASWGLGQVMGFNYAICGYPTVDAFVDAMKWSEGKQLDASVDFILHNDLDDELRRHDWAGFARGYNGKNYRDNDYDTKLRTAYRKYAAHGLECPEDSVEADEDPAANSVSTVELGEKVDSQSAISVPDPPPPSDTNSAATKTTNVTAVDEENKTVLQQQTTQVEDRPGTNPNDPAVQVSTGGGISRFLTTIGGVGGLVTAAGGYFSGNAGLIAVGIVCATIVILALIFRQIIMDWARVHIAADPNRYNVK
jgi:hypothetical protein